MNQVTYLSKCPKLKQGQLLMQRYKFINSYAHGKYKAQGDRAKEKSVELAKRMKAHARECPLCSPQDENFYGLDHWNW